MAKAKAKKPAAKQPAVKKAPAKARAGKKPTVVKKAPAKKPPAKKATKPKSVEVTGHSMTFSFEEALRDALAQAHEKRPAPPRNPDAAVRVTVTEIGALSGGNIRPGLSVTVRLD